MNPNTLSMCSETLYHENLYIRSTDVCHKDEWGNSMKGMTYQCNNSPLLSRVTSAWGSTSISEHLNFSVYFTFLRFYSLSIFVFFLKEKDVKTLVNAENIFLTHKHCAEHPFLVKIHNTGTSATWMTGKNTLWKKLFSSKFLYALKSQVKICPS